MFMVRRATATSAALGFVVAAGVTLASGCNRGDEGFDFATMGMGSAAPADEGTDSEGPDTEGEDTEGPGEDTMGPMDTEGPADTGTGTGGGSDSGSDDGSDDGLPVEPCTGMDILFVVDNSQTMLEEQVRMASNAATWLMAVNNATATAANNINVGVITTDESAMVTATEMPCNFASGLPYMQIGGMMFDQMAFAAEVQCALAVGTDGSSDERPIERMLEALSPAFVQGGPNDGFLRDDSLLVVVIMTDEEDDFEKATNWGSEGDPPQWIDDLAAVKGGIEKDVIVLSFIGLDAPNECPPHQWDGMTGAELSPRLQEFTEGFPAGAVHDLCAADYFGFLNGVVPGISGSCMNFSPP